MNQPHAANNFDFLRFFAATLVIWSHAFPLSGRPEHLGSPLIGETSGGIAVAIFFVISGFLVTGSLLNSSSKISYFKKRFLRIYPGFFVSVLFCFFVIAPLCSSFGIREFFLNSASYGYLKTLSMYLIQHQVPGVLEGNPHPGSINGSYWTLPVEFSMYIVIALFALLGVFRPWFLILAIVGAMVFYALVTHEPRNSFTQYYIHARYAALFLYGALFYIFKDRIPYRLHWFLLCIAIVVMTQLVPALKAPADLCMHNLLCGKQILYSQLIFSLLLPYIILYIAHRPLPILKDFGRYGDFSYGIYLYAFPVQQCIVYHFGAELPVIVHFSATLLVTLVLAIASWHLVEKPCLKFKPHIK